MFRQCVYSVPAVARKAQHIVDFHFLYIKYILYYKGLLLFLSPFPFSFSETYT